MATVKYGILTKYISQIYDDTIGEWVIDRKNDGTPGHPIQMPYVNYSEMVYRFIKDVSAFKENNKDMGLDRYREIMEENGFMNDKSIAAADEATLTPQCILALITGVIRTERFCDGVLLDYFKNGCIRKWLEKLQALDCAEQLFISRLILRFYLSVNQGHKAVHSFIKRTQFFLVRQKKRSMNIWVTKIFHVTVFNNGVVGYMTSATSR